MLDGEHMFSWKAGIFRTTWAIVRALKILWQWVNWWHFKLRDLHFACLSVIIVNQPSTTFVCVRMEEHVLWIRERHAVCTTELDKWEYAWCHVNLHTLCLEWSFEVYRLFYVRQCLCILMGFRTKSSYFPMQH
jgi:hypothetical protein